MLTTYKAVLRGNQLEWGEDVPQQAATGEDVDVHVTVLDRPPAREDRGQRMAAALSKLARSHTVAGVDARQWEREMRQDRPLDGRDR